MRTLATKPSVPQSSAEYNMTARKQTSPKTERMLNRANNLFVDGYRAAEILHNLYRVMAPTGSSYVVDLRDWTCECPAYHSRQYVDTKGRVTCKHLCGCRNLLDDQRIALQSEAAIEAAMAAIEYRRLDNEVNRLIERMAAAVSEAERLYYARQCEDAEAAAREHLSENRIPVFGHPAQEVM